MKILNFLCFLCQGYAATIALTATRKDGTNELGVLDESHYYRIYDTESSSYLPGGNRPGRATNSHSCSNIRAVPSNLRTGSEMYPRGLGYFYQKYTEAYGIPVVGSNQVSNGALQRACYLLRFMLADRYDVRNAFYKAAGRVAIIGVNEGTTNIPEHSHLPPSWNQRARGLGATWNAPVSSGGEENALCLGKDRYRSEDIVLHEYMHAVHNIGAKRAIPNFENRLTALYNSAKATGKWANTYSMSTVQEYWAEGCQSYFNVNRHSPRPDGIQGPISNRNALRGYDQGLYNIIREVFPCDNNYIKRCEKNRGSELNQVLRMNCRGGGGGQVTSAPTSRPTQRPRPTQGPTGGTGSCVDTSVLCGLWAMTGECQRSPSFMIPNCRKSCNRCSTTGTGSGSCTDKNTNCSYWARSGECQKNPGYMIPNCKRSCNRC